MATPPSRFHAQTFAEDVTNAVCDYCADGIDAFEKCLEGAPLLEPEVIQEIRMGIEQLGAHLLDRMGPNLALFQRLSTMAVFNAPDRAPLHQDNARSGSQITRTPIKSKQELDATLHNLRSQLEQAINQRTQLQAEVAQLDAEIRQHGHLAAHTAALASALQVRSAPTPGPAGQSISQTPAAPDIAASIAAIAAGVAKLQPLLQKAQRLRVQKLPSGAMTADAAVAVEVKTSQLTKACGTLQDLQALKGLLDVGRTMQPSMDLS